MEWEFTAEQVVKAEVAYDLAAFRRDLAEEVRMNMDGADEAQRMRAYNLIYDLCHALATNRALDEFLAAYAFDPPACAFLRELQPLMGGNVEMLGSILQRMIMDRIESGLVLEQAVEAVAAEHGAIVARGTAAAMT